MSQIQTIEESVTIDILTAASQVKLWTLLRDCCRFDILSQLGCDTTGAICSDSIADNLSFNRNIVYRVLRYLSGFGYTKEIKYGYFTHTPKSLELSNNKGLASMLVSMFNVVHLLPCLNYYHIFKTGEPAYMGYQGKLGMSNNHKALRNRIVNLDFVNRRGWDYMAINDSTEASFVEFMRYISNQDQIGELLIKSYDFSDDDDVDSIIDIGGSHGELIICILKHIQDKYKKRIKGIVFDRENVINQAKTQFDKRNIDLNLNLDVNFVIGDFFKPVEHCCDIYLLMQCLHDWTDDQCIKILINIKDAMIKQNLNKFEKTKKKKQSRLLIIERILDDSKTGMNKNSEAKELDILLMGLVSGKERTLNEFDFIINKSGLIRNKQPIHLINEMHAIEVVAPHLGNHNHDQFKNFVVFQSKL